MPHLDPPPPNLTVWLSQDEDNGDEVAWAQRRYPWAKRAVLVERRDVAEGDLICPKLRYREGTATPILPTAGACARCRICAVPPPRVSRVVFPTKHYTHFQPPIDIPLPSQPIEELHAVA